MSTKLKLLKILADGHFHSGEKLGAALGVSRTAVWKQVQTLQLLGLDCYSVSGKGYRLSAALELLERDSVFAAMTATAKSLVAEIELHPEIDSSNRYLMDKLSKGLEHGHACMAERQTAGRGRRGRPWVSPFARNIYMSFYWRFEMTPELLSGLALAIGVGVIRALRQLEINDASLKWPNDILWQGRKLAGILLEMRGESAGPYHVVIGVGLNVDMSKENSSTEIDQPWVDLQHIAAQPISRNKIAGVLLSELLLVAEQFQRSGLTPFLDEWIAADAYSDKSVVILQGDEQITGYARGVDSNGAIILETDTGVRQFHSGEVSLRLQDQ